MSNLYSGSITSGKTFRNYSLLLGRKAHSCKHRIRDISTSLSNAFVLSGDSRENSRPHTCRDVTLQITKHGFLLDRESGSCLWEMLQDPPAARYIPPQPRGSRDKQAMPCSAAATLLPSNCAIKHVLRIFILHTGECQCMFFCTK